MVSRLNSASAPTGSQGRGFTLIELLVVLGIIVLLIGLLLPTLSTARRYSREVSCAATLRGIGAGWVLYTQAYPQSLPVAVSLPSPMTTPAPGEITLMRCLAQQVPSAKAYRCPGDDLGMFDTHRTSYEYWPGIAIALDPANAQVLAQYARRHPDQVPVLGDAEVFHASRSTPFRRQALYYDAHVDWLKLPEVQ